jgi:hypothetical protein
MNNTPLDIRRLEQLVSTFTRCKDPQKVSRFVEINEELRSTPLREVSPQRLIETFEDFELTYIEPIAEDTEFVIEDVKVPEKTEGPKSLRMINMPGPTVTEEYANNTVAAALINLSDIIAMADSIIVEIGELPEIDQNVVTLLDAAYESLGKAHDSLGLDFALTTVDELEFDDISDTTEEDMIEYHPEIPLDPFTSAVVTYKEGAEEGRVIDEKRLKQLAQMGLLDKTAIAPTLRAINELLNGKTQPSSQSRGYTNALLLRLIGLITGDDALFAKTKAIV